MSSPEHDLPAEPLPDTDALSLPPGDVFDAATGRAEGRFYLMTPDLAATPDEAFARNPAVERAVLRTARRKGAADPDGILQEVYLRGMSRELGPGAVGWAAVTASNLIIDQYRRGRSRPQEVPLDHPDRPEPTDPSDSIQSALARVVTDQILEGLSPEHQKILKATFVEGLTAPEAAEKLGIPLGTAKSRVRWALIHARERAAKLGLRAEDAA